MAAVERVAEAREGMEEMGTEARSGMEELGTGT
jgi:hypothetical protein